MIQKNVIDMPKLAELRGKGCKPEEIAEALGVTLQTVRTILGAVDRSVLQVASKKGYLHRKCA